MQEQENKCILSPEELDAQLDTVLRFLRTVHPSLLAEDKYKPCVELRPINRGDRNYSLSLSCNIWDLSDESVNRVRKWLVKHNGAPTCLYYSVFNYDNLLKARTAKGAQAKPGRITTEAALSTSEIAIDFDHIGFDGYTELVDRFEAMGIFALWVNSGHGYQAHILLKDSLADKTVLRRLVYKFRAKGFDCDPACTDPARVMRLPGTFNKKGLNDPVYRFERNDPPKCDVVQNSTQRYNLEDIIRALDKLPTVSEEDEQVYLGVSNTRAERERPLKPKAVKTAHAGKAPVQEAVEDTDIIKKIEYPFLSDLDLPEPVSKMLAYTPHGYRNPALGFLIRFFKSHYRFGKEQLLPILKLWSTEACDPPYKPDEFKIDFNRLYYNYNGLNYTPALAKQFGSIDFDSLIHIRKKVISIPNKLFREFSELDGKAVRVYLAIKLLEHQGKDATQDALAELLGITTRALRPSIQALEKSSFAYKAGGNRTLGIPFSYKTSRIITRDDGYKTFSYNDIKAYITELHDEGSRANGALKLFLYMHYKYYSGDIYVSQVKLGESIGSPQRTVSSMVAKLEELHFIKVTKVRNSFLESCSYTLLR